MLVNNRIIVILHLPAGINPRQTTATMKTTIKSGSYEATVTEINIDGKEYRVKVTYNNGDNMAFLKTYSNEKTAIRAAKRELAKII